MKFVVKAPAGQAAQSSLKLANQMATALTEAMREVGRIALAKGRDSIAASGLGRRWVRSLRLITRPKRGFSFEPSAYVHSRINYSDVFETGRTIKGAPLLWLPLPNVPKVNGRQVTPAQFSKQFGKLTTIRRKGKAPLLGVHVSGRVSKRITKRTRIGKSILGGTHVVPVYVGVPSVTLPKKFDVHSAAEKAFEQFGDIYKQKMNELNNGR